MRNNNNNDIIDSNNNIDADYSIQFFIFTCLTAAEANCRASIKKQMKIDGNNIEMLDNTCTYI
jgi:hypothetical protein